MKNIKKIFLVILFLLSFSCNLFCMQNSYLKVGVFPYAQDADGNFKVLLGRDIREGWSIFSGKQFFQTDPIQSAMQVFFDKTRGFFPDLRREDFLNYIFTIGFSESPELSELCEPDYTLFFVKIPYIPAEIIENGPIINPKVSATINKFVWVDLKELRSIGDKKIKYTFVKTEQNSFIKLFYAFVYNLKKEEVQGKISQIIEKRIENLDLENLFNYKSGYVGIYDDFETVQKVILNVPRQTNVVSFFISRDNRILLFLDKRGLWTTFSTNFINQQNSKILKKLILSRSGDFINLDSCAFYGAFYFVQEKQIVLFFYLNDGFENSINNKNWPQSNIIDYKLINCSNFLNENYFVYDGLVYDSNVQKLRLFPSVAFTINLPYVQEIIKDISYASVVMPYTTEIDMTNDFLKKLNLNI
ncbi:hypothetical protein K9L05_01920 [Candidatus Babeliales bacterium]|nr:hypothetical protein [Candidatus Babeliales bacterium]